MDRASKVELVVKNLPDSTGDTRDAGLIPGSGRSSGEGNGNLLQYSCLENSLGRGSSPTGYSPWGFKESDTTDRLTLSLSVYPTLLWESTFSR